MFVLGSLVACTEGSITPEMETGATATSDALSAALVAGQSASFAAAESTRATCPVVTKDGTLASFVVTADYGEGCEPTSGVLPGPVSGAVSVAYESRAVTVGFDEWTVDGAGVDGTVVGTASGVSLQGLELTLDTDLAFTTPATAVQSLVVAFGPTDVVVDGAADVETPEYVASTSTEGVALAYEDVLVAACPLPHAGVATVESDGHTVTVTFDEETPATGTVTVTYDGRSAEVPLCDYAGTLY